MALLKYSIITNGKKHEQTLELTQNETGIGRDPASTIVLTLDGVSRHHARIRKTDDGYLLMDKDSTNGVFLNEKKIHEHPLQHGDVFRVGTTSFIFN